PLRKEPVPLGLGLGTTFHFEPFQCSINGETLPGQQLYPTAQMLFAETTVTPFRMSFNDPGEPGFGLGTTFQFVPFQCSISVWMELLLEQQLYPTAQMLFAET